MMYRIVRHLEYLIRRSNGEGCVVLPGIGAVLSRRLPARYDLDCGCLLAPAVEFAFNPSVDSTDGALASSLMRTDSTLSYDEASRIVNRETDLMQAELKRGAVLSLGRIGSLQMEDGHLEFSPAAAEGLFPENSWLKPVRVSNAALAAAEEEDRVSQELIDAVRNSLRSRLIRLGRIAATVAVLIGLGFAVNSILERTAPATQQAGFTPDIRTTSVKRPGTASSPLVLVLNAHEDAVTVVDTTSVAPRPKAHENSGPYVLVVASLGSQREAEQYIRRHPDLDLRYYCSQDRYRVYAASGANSQSVREYARTAGLDTMFDGAWVCRK